MKKIPVRNIHSVKVPVAGQFSIRKMEDILKGENLQHDLHRHSFYFVLLLEKGKGVHEIDFVSHKVVDGSVFLLRPGQVHQLQLMAGARGYLMEFDTEFYHRNDKTTGQRLQKAGNRNFCRPAATGFKKLYSLLDNIYGEYTNKENGYPDIIKASLDIFYIEFLRQSTDPKLPATVAGSYAQDRFDEFMNLLETHIATSKQVAQYTALMSLSSYQLNEITKSLVGKTASALIDEHILLEAKRYLLATNNQVKDIADQLGYEDVSYFIRFFKKHTGHSPELFRRNFA